MSKKKGVKHWRDRVKRETTEREQDIRQKGKNIWIGKIDNKVRDIATGHKCKLIIVDYSNPNNYEFVLHLVCQ